MHTYSCYKAKSMRIQAGVWEHCGTALCFDQCTPISVTCTVEPGASLAQHKFGEFIYTYQ